MEHIVYLLASFPIACRPPSRRLLRSPMPSAPQDSLDRLGRPDVPLPLRLREAACRRWRRRARGAAATECAMTALLDASELDQLRGETDSGNASHGIAGSERGFGNSASRIIVRSAGSGTVAIQAYRAQSCGCPGSGGSGQNAMTCALHPAQKKPSTWDSSTRIIPHHRSRDRCTSCGCHSSLSPASAA